MVDNRYPTKEVIVTEKSVAKLLGVDYRYLPRIKGSKTTGSRVLNPGY